MDSQDDIKEQKGDLRKLGDVEVYETQDVETDEDGYQPPLKEKFIMSLRSVTQDRGVWYVAGLVDATLIMMAYSHFMR